jgi:hypothetical protein
VILWQTLGVTDHTQARYLLGQYLNRCQKWARVGFTAPLDRRRRLQRSLRQSRHGDGFIFRYIFTNECGADKGFHSHVLANVPQSLGPVFEAWSRQTLAKLARHPWTEKTVMVRVSAAKNEHDAVEGQWRFTGGKVWEATSSITAAPRCSMSFNCQRAGTSRYRHCCTVRSFAPNSRAARSTMYRRDFHCGTVPKRARSSTKRYIATETQNTR